MKSIKKGAVGVAATVFGVVVASTPTFAIVNTSDIADNAVTSVKIANGTIEAGDIMSNSISALQIGQGSVKSSEIKTDAVGASEIAANAVGSAEVATDAVGTAEIAADAVGTNEIATDGVAAAEIATGAVGTAEVADGTVASADIAADTIDDADVVDNGLDATSLGADSVSTSEIASNGVGNAELADSITVPGLLTLGRQTFAVTDDGTANDTLTVTSNYVELEQDATANAGAAAITMSETGVAEGDMVTIVRNDANAGDVTFTESDGVQELASTFTSSAGQFDTITLVYTGTAWVEVSRSENG